MGAGAYNERVEVLKKTVTYADNGEPIETWVSDFFVWAKVTTTGGGEFYAAQKIIAETEALFSIRVTDRISELNRIKHRNVIYQLLSPPNNVDKRELKISAKAVT